MAVVSGSMKALGFGELLLTGERCFGDSQEPSAAPRNEPSRSYFAAFRWRFGHETLGLMDANGI